MIRFKTFRYSLGILIISAALCGFWQSANAQVVEIPDPNLERAIREELGLSSEFPVTQQEMLKLFRLSAKDMQIENLAGIEYAHNLEDLVIPHNPISGLTLIASLRDSAVVTELVNRPINGSHCIAVVKERRIILVPIY